MGGEGRGGQSWVALGDEECRRSLGVGDERLFGLIRQAGSGGRVLVDDTQVMLEAAALDRSAAPVSPCLVGRRVGLSFAGGRKGRPARRKKAQGGGGQGRRGESQASHPRGRLSYVAWACDGAAAARSHCVSHTTLVGPVVCLGGHPLRGRTIRRQRASTLPKGFQGAASMLPSVVSPILLFRGSFGI